MKSSTLAKKIGFYAMIIIVWQGLDSADIWPDNIFPSPVDVAEDLAYGVADASLFYGIGTSLLRLSIGSINSYCWWLGTWNFHGKSRNC